MARVSALLLTGSLLGLAACSSAPAPVPHHLLAFHAHADVGEPLAGVRIWADANGDRTMTDNEVLGTTNATGIVMIDHVAPYGTILNIAAACPAGHREPAAMAPIALHPVQTTGAVAAHGIEHTIECLPINRDAVVVIRATGMCAPPAVEGASTSRSAVPAAMVPCPVANVPVLLDGREVAHTDDSGIAHIAVSKTPNSSFRLELAAGTINTLLVPAQATRDFMIPDEDQIMRFDQAFALNTPPPPPRTARRAPRRPIVQAPVRRIPSRIGGRSR